MNSGHSEVLKERYPVLRNDSIYRPETYQVRGSDGESLVTLSHCQATNRTLTPVLAGLAELIKVTPEYSQEGSVWRGVWEDGRRRRGGGEDGCVILSNDVEGFSPD